MLTGPNPRGTTRPDLENSVAKLAILGEQAGFKVQDMVNLLQAGLTLETLLDLIAWRLESPVPGELPRAGVSAS
jgi:hypothetical protein